MHLYYLYKEPTKAQLINNVLYCSLLHCPYLACTDYELPEDGAIASKHVGQRNKERYNKLLISCAFVGSLYKAF
jgi:hypothetical protein